MKKLLPIHCCSRSFGEASRCLSVITNKDNQCRLLDCSKCGNFMVIAVLSSINASHTLESQRLNDEYFMAISAVADPPVAIKMRFSALTLLGSLHRTSIFVAYASPLPPQQEWIRSFKRITKRQRKGEHRKRKRSLQRRSMGER